MKLSNRHLAIVGRPKVTDYLLNSTHPYGASKARFFASFGFSLSTWESLVTALLEHGRTHDVQGVTHTRFGPQYEVDGRLHTPDNRNPWLRTVWQMDTSQIAPRLITAYPLEGEHDQGT